LGVNQKSKTTSARHPNDVQWRQKFPNSIKGRQKSILISKLVYTGASAAAAAATAAAVAEAAAAAARCGLRRTPLGDQK